MAKSCFSTPIQSSNTLHHSKTHMFTINIQVLLHISICNIPLYSRALLTELTDTDNYLPSGDPNITNLMVSHYDCEKQHSLRQFILLNVKPCTEALKTFNMLKFEPEFMFKLKLNELKLLNVKLTLRSFQGSVKYRRVDQTVRNHKALPLPITLDPLECKNPIRTLLDPVRM